VQQLRREREIIDAGAQAWRSKAISNVSAGLQHKATDDLITVVAQMLATVIRTELRDDDRPVGRL
jgi:hypothetical protein